MPRQLRIEYAGAIYHVLSRGDRQKAIFLDDVDRHDFLIKGLKPYYCPIRLDGKKRGHPYFGSFSQRRSAVSGKGGSPLLRAGDAW